MSQESQYTCNQTPRLGTMGACYAYYRLPYADTYTVIESESEPLLLPSLQDIGGSAGFVIAPFRQSSECPIVLIKPDKIEERQYMPDNGLSAVSNGQCSVSHDNEEPSPEYTSAFNAFHNAVVNKKFHKLVLARSKTYQQHHPGRVEVVSLFLRACQLYPRLTIILFSTPQTGTWLIASPEILVEGKAGSYHTVALAGTMSYNTPTRHSNPLTTGKDQLAGIASGCAGESLLGESLGLGRVFDWSEKNKKEQHIVEQYIADTITPMASDILTDGPVTMRAGNLVHLRTDFRFHLKQGNTLGAVVSHLHPTPAVCGLPKQQARDFILCNEHLDRRYYSGFSGPVNIHGETHLYVSLRCAQLCCDKAILYAGGGIMPDSQCLSEWQETEQKIKTIANVLQ